MKNLNVSLMHQRTFYSYTLEQLFSLPGLKKTATGQTPSNGKTATANPGWGSP